VGLVKTRPTLLSAKPALLAGEQVVQKNWPAVAVRADIQYLHGMSWSTLLGHSREIDKLRLSAVSGRLAHAYAFVGSSGIGKKRFAFELARCLLCDKHADAELDSCGLCASCQQVDARTHPDLFTVSLPEGKSELPIKLFVGEGETRGKEGLCHDLSLKPMSARRRVAIIDDAEWMSEPAANALLKTLEEPPPNSVLILIATSADQLLATIRSRCQVLTFQPLSPADIQKLLIQEGIATNETEAAQVAGLCDGSLDAARQLLDPDLRSLRDELYNLLAADPFRSVQTAARMIESLDSAGSEKSSQREYAGWVVRFCVEFFRRALLAVAGGLGSRAGEIPQALLFVERLGDSSVETIDRVAELIERCLAAEGQLEANAAIPLCLDTLFDDLGRAMRRG
jgi:DNA polymerase-3 subunit delta'